MSETLEQRIRRTASDNPIMGTFVAFASDIVELLDEKENTISRLRAIEAERDALRTSVLKVAQWAERQSERLERHADGTRFSTIADQDKKDAVVFRKIAADLRVALTAALESK